jgi:NADH:ubiquinone oxidoreductase subunit
LLQEKKTKMSNYLRLYNRVGFKGMLTHLYTFRAVKEGTLVGMDELGNKYYENNNLPYGQHRWYEPAEYQHPGKQEPSSVPPAWHGWLHCTHDQPPSIPHPDRTGEPIIDHSDASNSTHTTGSELRAPWRPNPTLKRDRGFNLPGEQAQGENAFYTQSGHPLSPVFNAALGGPVQAWKPTSKPAATTKATPVPLTKWEQFQKQRDAMNVKGV